MQGLFIVGTDTGVGKTVVTGTIARLLRRQRHPVRVCKPVATGATLVEGRLRADDTWHLAQAVAFSQPLEQITPWTFLEPAAPPVAARLAGVDLKLTQLVDAVNACASPDSLLLVEGVGGLLCPLTADETVADLAALLGLPLVVVARRSLGTLNHTLMTVEIAQTRGLLVAGVVVNETTPLDGVAERTNVDELRSRLTVPILAVVPHDAPDGDTMLEAVSRVDWWQLAQSPARSLCSARGADDFPSQGSSAWNP